MLNQYTFLNNPYQITMGHIRSYRKLLVDDHIISWWTSPECTVPWPIEIRREINANWWVVVLNDSWKVVWGSYITKLPEFQRFQMGELGGSNVLISERQKWISNRTVEILLNKNINTPLYSVVWEATSRRHTRLWHATLNPDKLWIFFQNILAAYWALDWQIILANDHAQELLTSEHY